MQRDQAKRLLEIQQLKLVLIYASKTLKMCSDALSQLGVTNTFEDKNGLLASLFAGSKNIEDDDLKTD